MDHRIDQTSPASQYSGYGVVEDVDSVTDLVLRAMSRTPNARLREIMESSVRHLHAFAREVQLAEAEYDVAIDFLNRIGKATNDAHNEGILFTDAVGFSTLVCLLNNSAHGAPQTAAALLGPF
jgi:catechol 1,2-dioxygenase